MTLRYVSGRNDYRGRVEYCKTALTATHSHAECEMSGCITFTNSTDCSVSGCTFEHIGVYGIDIIGTGRNIAVDGCTFLDLGSGALKTQHERNNTQYIHIKGVNFTNNHVDGYGKAYLAACAVLLTHVSDSAVDNNDICDGDYTAVSLGWTWGYDNIG